MRDADDWLLGFAGPTPAAKAITARLRAFRRDGLTLERSASQTLSTHATSPAARVRGDAVRAPHADDTRDRRGPRAVHAAIGLVVPTPVLRQRRARARSAGNPAPRGARRHDDDFPLVATSQAEDRGRGPDDLRAQEVFRLSPRPWVREPARLKTLAGQHRATVTPMARTYQATIETPEGPRACLQGTVARAGGRKPLVARCGGIPRRRQRPAVRTDVSPVMASPRRHALLPRLLTEGCEGCDAQVPREVHPVRTRADLHPPGRRERPAGMPLMATRRRKPLVGCRRGHEAIHAGRVTVPVRK